MKKYFEGATVEEVAVLAGLHVYCVAHFSRNFLVTDRSCDAASAPLRISVQGLDIVHLWQVVTEEIWRKAVHAAAAIPNQGSLLALWQWLALNQHDWSARSGAAQVMSAHVLATSKPKQGHLCNCSVVGKHLHEPTC